MRKVKGIQGDKQGLYIVYFIHTDKMSMPANCDKLCFYNVLSIIIV